MIIVKMWGGLGNQMFQYAFGKALEKRYKEELFFDIDFYKKQPSYVGIRKLEIEKGLDIKEFKRIERPKQVEILENRMINRIIRIPNQFYVDLPRNVRFIKEKTRTYMDDLHYVRAKVNYYDGYWLTNKYFENVEDTIRNEYNMKIQDGERELIYRENTVSIHIRRGDYLKGRNMPGGYTENSIIEYYRRAIQYMNERLHKPSYIVFSDDIQWCKKTFSNINNIHYSNFKGENAVFQDLFGISKCQHGIMSPSTFSWWGNWLRDPSIESIVIAPKGEYNNIFFIKDDWVKL